MTNKEANFKCQLAGLLSYSTQVGIITSLHLRKNQTKISVKINEDIEEIKKIAEAKKTKDSKPNESEKAIEEYLGKEFEGNFFMVPLSEIGNVKGESIKLSDGGEVDAKWLVEQLIGSVVIIPET